MNTCPYCGEEIPLKVEVFQFGIHCPHCNKPCEHLAIGGYTHGSRTRRAKKLV